MPHRRLPLSDEDRRSAMQNAKAKSDAVGEASVIFVDTKTRLGTFLPKFILEMDDAAGSLRNQATSTTQHNENAQKLKLVISHFIQVFNFGIARGVYTPEDRAHYGLAITQEELPKLTSFNDLDVWAANIFRGETARTTAGGTAMSNPSAAELQVVYDAYLASMADKSEKKDEYDSAQEDVEELRAEADELITEIWDEVEWAYRKDDPPSRRRKAKEYGVVYVYAPGEEEEEPVVE